MTQANVPVSSPLDAALNKIDAVLGVVSMNTEQLQAHVVDELAKSAAEAASGKQETATARVVHLKAQTELAKAVFDSGATLAPITMFKDPWQTMPNSPATKTTTENQQPPTGASNIEFKEDVVFVTTEKGAREFSPLLKALYSIGKSANASRTKVLAKADGASIIAKAGESTAILEKIAAMFGIKLSDDGVLDCEFRWTVGDTISALQNAAKLEAVMMQMGGGLAKAEPTPAPATPAPAPAPAASAEVAWPSDMSKAETTGGPDWGFDSGPVPTN